MSDNRSLLIDLGDRLFTDLRDKLEDGENGWPALATAGFHSLFKPEEAEGFGGDWGDAVALLYLSGTQPVNSPLAEVLAASWLERQAGLMSDAVSVVACVEQGSVESGKFSGKVNDVPVAEGVENLVAAINGKLIRISIGSADSTTETFNAAGEPRHILTFRDVPVEVGDRSDNPSLWGALARTAQIAGALDGALKLSIEYANERQQFGRPISKFQSVQQSLALLAEEAAAVNCAAQAAAQAADAGDATLEIACAKLRAGKAAATGVEIAHQVHGAIGFTKEYPLHDFTRRLVVWRSEFGNERYWSERVCHWTVEQGGFGLWRGLTARSDRIGKAS